MAVLLAEMDRFYGAAGTEPPDERLRQISEALFASPPAAYALLASETPGWPVSLGYYRPMLFPGHSIETPRLTLRPFTPGDFDDLYAYQSRPDVTVRRSGRPWIASAVRPRWTRKAIG